MANSAATANYQPRHVRFLHYTSVGEWQLKVYGIALWGKSVRGDLVDAVPALAQLALPSPTSSQSHEEVGFVVIHDAADYAYVLVHWWEGGNEIHQRLYSAPANGTSEMRPHEGAAIGCVWELSVVDFERRCWIDNILKPSTGPDKDAYLRSQFNADV